MATTTSPRSKPKKKTKAAGGAAVPAALARRAAAAAAVKNDRLRRDAHAHLALIARRKNEITEAFYDIGEALAKLQNADMIRALGRRTFAEVCQKDARMSVATAERLIQIAGAMTREQALSMGQTKAMAMVSLAAATPEADTAAGLFLKKSVKLPGGRAVSPRSATARELERAAAAIRHSRSDDGAKARRGRTTTPDERALAALLQKSLHTHGLDRARVTAVATKPGQGADLRFEHIPAAKVDVLKKAIGR